MWLYRVKAPTNANWWIIYARSVDETTIGMPRRGGKNNKERRVSFLSPTPFLPIHSFALFVVKAARKLQFGKAAGRNLLSAFHAYHELDRRECALGWMKWSGKCSLRWFSAKRFGHRRCFKFCVETIKERKWICCRWEKLLFERRWRVGECNSIWCHYRRFNAEEQLCSS